MTPTSLLSFAVTLVLAGIALVTAAASPSAPPGAPASSSGSSSAVPGPTMSVEVWLDRPLPTDAAPGSRIPIGATIWDRTGRAFVSGTPVVVRLHPATGTSTPTESIASPDGPGHVAGLIAIPDGGLGKLEIGVRGSACTDVGCEQADSVLPVAGIGPPEDAPLPLIATAEIQPPPTTRLVAGRPAEVDILLHPKVAWGSAFAMPTSLVIQVRVPRGPILDDVAATLVDAQAGRYRASITLPDTAPYVLQVAAHPDADVSDTFAASVQNVTAQSAAAATPAATSPSSTGSTGDSSLIALGLLAIAGVMVLGLVLVVRRSGG